MEADWEIELGSGLPVIDTGWPAHIDLHRSPLRITEIEEANRLPALRYVLTRLNEKSAVPNRQLRTAKCDIWMASGEDSQAVDPDEMDADPQDAQAILACYIDILPGTVDVFPALADAKQWTLEAVTALKAISCRRSRVDLVIRRAASPAQEGFGVTAYIAGCGADLTAAEESISNALAGFANALTLDTGSAATDKNARMKEMGE